MLKFSGYPYLIRGQPLERSARRHTWLAGCQRGPAKREVKFYYASGLAGPPLLFGDAAVGEPQDQALLERCNDARTGMPLGIPKGAMCVQRFDDSLNSAIHITYRISLRSSSMPEPRDPLLKVLIITFELRRQGFNWWFEGLLTGVGRHRPAARQSNIGT